MLESVSIDKKHVGEDGFYWFIGQVVLDKAWRDDKSGKEKDADKQSRKFGYRAKVRILGKHPHLDIVKDEELPWAHFLVPPTMGTGVNYHGVSSQIQGGETVFGFFLDGLDGQQPVIFGGLYQHENITGIKDWNSVISKGTSGFSPISVDPKLTTGSSTTQLGANVRPTDDGQPFKGGGLSNQNQEVISSSGALVKTVTKHFHNLPVEVRKATLCNTPAIAMGDVTKEMQGFIGKIQGLKKVKGGFLDPVLNRLVDMNNIIDKVSDKITGGLTGVIRTTRSQLFAKIDEKLGDAIDMLKPDFLTKKIAALKQKEGLYCLMENMLSGLKNLIKGFLKGLLGKIISFPLCAAEQFLGGLFSKITNKIQKLIGGPMAALGMLGGIQMPNFSSMLGKAFGAAQSLLKLISCEPSACDPNPADWTTNSGPSLKKGLNIKRMIGITASLGKMDLSVTGVLGAALPQLGKIGETVSTVKGLAGTVTRMGNSLSDLGSSELGGCNTSSKECGPPRIEIFGGGGIGAIAKAVVSETGKVVGANMEDLGLGYDEEPYVTIIDDCDNGKGATGRAILKDGKVIKIVMDEGGGGYLGGGSEEGDAVIGAVDGADVVNTGSGYVKGDYIETSNGGRLEPEIEDGRITGVSGIVDIGLGDIPELTVITKTGFGAFIKPITIFKPVEEYSDPVVANAQILTVVDCPKGY